MVTMTDLWLFAGAILLGVICNLLWNLYRRNK